MPGGEREAVLELEVEDVHRDPAERRRDLAHRPVEIGLKLELVRGAEPMGPPPQHVGAAGVELVAHRLGEGRRRQRATDDLAAGAGIHVALEASAGRGDVASRSMRNPP